MADVELKPSVADSAAKDDELIELDAELAELEADRDRVRAETDARFKADRKRSQVERARTELQNEELFARAEAQLGRRGRDWDAVLTAKGAVVVKRPHVMHYKRWQDDGLKTTAVALETLCKHALFEISWKDYCKVVEDEAATLLKTASVLNRLAGGRAEELEGK